MGRSGGNRGAQAGAVRRIPALADPPLVELPLLWHIGTMDEADRGVNWGDSYEGHALSVSRDPEEWERIAELGGNPWWLLRNRQAKFLDAHKLTDVQREQVIDWAVSHGYAERVDLYEARLGYDDELEQERVMVVETPEEAEEEADSYGLDDGDTTIRPFASFRTSQAFLDRIGATRGMLADLDRLLVLFVDETMPNIDGVWFEDVYGPMSAPRGGILPSRLERWQKRKMRDTGQSRR